MSRTLGHYSITGEIGRGGMAVVYSAVQESLNRVVALKELNLTRFHGESNAIERFRLEARSAASLDHPNIITIYDLWEEGDKVYIAMEHIDGVELKDVLIRHGAMEFVSVIRIAKEVCAALHYAHGRGMVHRDVKPGNIMLSRKGEIRLMDFGIVSVSGSGDLTITGQVLGTPAYMSPEQISGGDLGPGADMFSLGVVAYEMLTGRRPFSGDNQLALIQQVMTRQPVPPVEIVPELPPGLSETVLKCLEKRPEDRFPDMENLATELEKSLPERAPSLTSCVSRLVEATAAQKRIIKPEKNISPEGTSVLRPAQEVKTGVETGSTVLSFGEVVGSGKDKGQQYHSPYALEADPPADLPPLDLSGSGVAEEAKKPLVPEEEEIPLSLKELPPEEPEEVPRPGRGLKRRHLLWGILPLILLAGVVIWKFSNAPLPTGTAIKGLLPTGEKPAAEPTLLMVQAEPEVTVFIDGELLGEVKGSGMFEIEPGLHKVEAKNAGLGVKNYIVEIGPGEMKEIKVVWGDQ